MPTSLQHQVPSVVALLLLLALLIGGEDDQHGVGKYFEDLSQETSPQFVYIYDSSIKEPDFISSGRFNEMYVLWDGFLEKNIHTETYHYLEKIKFYKFDCNTDGFKKHATAQKYCDDLLVSPADRMHVFKRDYKDLYIDVDTIFNGDSFIAHVLDICLVDRVVLVQDPKFLDNSVLEVNAGRKDVIVAYLGMLGTQEHRVIMESALPYTDSIQFVITTEPAVMRHVESTAFQSNVTYEILYMHCLSAHCQSYTRFIGNLNTTSEDLNHFLRNIVSDLPLIAEMEGVDVFGVFPKDRLALTYIIYHKSFKEKNIYINSVATQFKGLMATVLISLEGREDEINSIFEVEFTESNFVSLCIKLKSQDSVDYYPQAELELETPSGIANLSRFIERALQSDLVDTATQNYTANFLKEFESDEDIPILVQDDTVIKISKQMAIEFEKEAMNNPHVAMITSDIWNENYDYHAVLHYMSWEANSQLALSIYRDVSLHLSFLFRPLGLNVSAVDCFEIPEICDRHNVSTYPALKLLTRSGDAFTFSGVFDSFSVTKFILTSTNANRRVLDLSPDFHSKLDNLVTRYHIPVVDGRFKSNCADADVTVYRELATDIMTATDNLAIFTLTKSSSQSQVIVTYWQDDEMKREILEGSFDREDFITSFVARNAPAHKNLELMTIYSWPEIKTRHGKVILLVIDNSSPSEATSMLDDVASDYSGVSFAYVNISQDATARQVITSILEYVKVDESWFLLMGGIPLYLYLDYTDGDGRYSAYRADPSLLSPHHALGMWLDKVLVGSEKCEKAECDVMKELFKEGPLPTNFKDAKVPPLDFLALIKQDEEEKDESIVSAVNRAVNLGRTSIHTGLSRNHPDEEDEDENGEDVENIHGDDIPEPHPTRHTHSEL